MPALLRARALERRDPILKERLFGLTGPQGNHGEDVKECYYYLDSTPTHSYMKALYKYPQARISLCAAGRGKRAPRRSTSREFELLDTGIFDERRYFDVFVEYAKGRAGRHSDPHHGRQSRAGGGDAARAADAVVSQHLDLGLRRTKAARSSRDSSNRARSRA